jgi:putative addiction module killer protein
VLAVEDFANYSRCNQSADDVGTLVIKTTDEFDAWLNQLSDRIAQRRNAARLKKVSFELLGDVKPVGKGVSELREHFCPVYRIYVKQQGLQLIIVPARGDKSSQTAGIATALRLAREF